MVLFLALECFSESSVAPTMSLGHGALTTTSLCVGEEEEEEGP